MYVSVLSLTCDSYDISSKVIPKNQHQTEKRNELENRKALAHEKLLQPFNTSANTFSLSFGCHMTIFVAIFFSHSLTRLRQSSLFPVFMTDLFSFFIVLCRDRARIKMKNERLRE